MYGRNLDLRNVPTSNLTSLIKKIYPFSVLYEILEKNMFKNRCCRHNLEAFQSYFHFIYFYDAPDKDFRNQLQSKLDSRMAE